MTLLAIIDSTTNKCVNVSSDDRDISEIEIPAPFFVINLETTIAIDWVFDESISDYVQVEGIGNGGIGDDWDGTKLVQPKPQ